MTDFIKFYVLRGDLFIKIEYISEKYIYYHLNFSPNPISNPIRIYDIKNNNIIIYHGDNESNIGVSEVIKINISKEYFYEEVYDYSNKKYNEIWDEIKIR